MEFIGYLVVFGRGRERNERTTRTMTTGGSSRQRRRYHGSCYVHLGWLLLILVCNFLDLSTSLTTLTTTTTRPTTTSHLDCRSQLMQELQTSCFTPYQVLDRVGRHVTPTVDSSGELARLVLVRLAKQYIVLDNHKNHKKNHNQQEQHHKQSTPQGYENNSMEVDHNILDAVVQSLFESSMATTSELNLANLVEGTKAYSVLARLLATSSMTTTTTTTTTTTQPPPTLQLDIPLSFWHQHADRIVPHLQEHEITGIHWALDCINSATLTTTSATTMMTTRKKSSNELIIPQAIQSAWTELQVPFRIFPNLLSSSLQEPIHNLSVANLCDEVNFRMDAIHTTSNQIVLERRETSWQGDAGVAPFVYGGKCMPTQPWSPTVRAVRDLLACSQQGPPQKQKQQQHKQQHSQFYDCALINHYPHGGSGMRYHCDPDQGTLWDYDTSVVSVGATRRFAIRRILPCNNKKNKKSSHDDESARDKDNHHHTFVVMHGDVTHMFGSCQQEFQHSVKKAQSKMDHAPRISLVFKRSLQGEEGGMMA